MPSIAEVREALDITTSAWKNYISQGVIQKQKLNTYEVSVVAQQIIRDKTNKINISKGEKTRFLSRIKKLEEHIFEFTNTNGGGSEKPKNVKEQVDLDISKEKLVKMKFNNKVLAKSYMPVDNVFEFVTSISSEFSAFLEPLVGKIKQLVPDMNARTHDELVKMMAIGRNNLSRHIEGKTTNELIQLFNPAEDTSSTESTEET